MIKVGTLYQTGGKTLPDSTAVESITNAYNYRKQ